MRLNRHFSKTYPRKASPSPPHMDGERGEDVGTAVGEGSDELCREPPMTAL
jgi:hypothetical protein